MRESRAKAVSPNERKKLLDCKRRRGQSNIVRTNSNATAIVPKTETQLITLNLIHLNHFFLFLLLFCALIAEPQDAGDTDK